jgi:hypothetical protein
MLSVIMLGTVMYMYMVSVTIKPISSSNIKLRLVYVECHNQANNVECHYADECLST